MEKDESKAVGVGVGDVIHGKYKVERVIGEGGMGLVVAAKHLTLDRSVALKVLNQKSQESQEALERFTREARAAARIQSEHVGRVLDVDAMPGGAPFIVMELLDGHDLSEEIRRNQRVPVEKAVAFMLQACEAIAEAHASGIVHRDLKPANLFLSKSASGNQMVKVLDFGISKITRREEAGSITANKALTNPTSMLGSPLYMSPEQMKASTEVDARTDIWSLGVILYELLSGRSPFDANTIPMICAAVLSQTPPPVGVVLSQMGVNTPIPDGIERIVQRCLQKDPEKRYRDIAHLARALSPFAPEQGKITLERISKLKDEQGMPAASPASVFPPASHREGSLTITSWGTPPPSPARKFLPLAIAGGVVAVIGVAALVVTLGKAEKSATAAVSDLPPTTAVATTAVATATPPPTPLTVTASASAPPVGTESAAASASVSASALVTTPVRPPPGGWRKPPEKGRTVGFGGRE